MTIQITADMLAGQYGSWNDHPDYPAWQWKDEVMNGDTRLGYWMWVAAHLEAKKHQDILAANPVLSDPDFEHRLKAWQEMHDRGQASAKRSLVRDVDDEQDREDPF